MTARRRRSPLDEFAYEAHRASRAAGDASALQRGGVPKLAKRVAKRVARRKATRLAYSLFRSMK